MYMEISCAWLAGLYISVLFHAMSSEIEPLMGVGYMKLSQYLRLN